MYDVYAFNHDKSKHSLDDVLDDVADNKSSISGIRNDLGTIDDRLNGIDQSIDGINDDIGSMGDTISTITNSLDDAETDIGTLKDDVDALQDDVETLQDRVTPIDSGGTGSITARAARHALGLNFDSGDVISGTFYGAGYVTDLGRYFVFEIPLSKVIDGSLSLVSIDVSIRQGGNYIFGTPSGGQDVKSITALAKLNGGVRVVLRPSSAPANVINNDVFGVVCTMSINVI